MRIIPSLLRLLASAFAAGGLGCEGPDARPNDPTVEREIVLPRRSVVFRINREDVSVERAVLTVYCSDPSDCRIDGRNVESTLTYRDLTAAERDTFYIPVERIAYRKKSGGAFAMSLKVFLKEIPARDDSMYYEILDDRYALISYRDADEAANSTILNARFRQNRVADLSEFLHALSRPIDVRLNRRALPVRD